MTLSFALGMAAMADEQADSLEQRLTAASQSLALFNFAEGYREFTAVREDCPPGTSAWRKATLGLAMCAQHITPATPNLIQQAQGLYQELAQSGEASPLTARAVISLGRLAELRDFAGDEVDLPAARTFYQQAIDRWPDSPTADEASLWLAGTYIQLFDQPDQIAQGARMLEQWLERRPENPFASAMWLYLGDAYCRFLKQNARAVECYVRADALGLPSEATAGLLYWRLAVLAEGAGKLDTAIAYYQKIIEISPTSGRGYESQLALRRLQQEHPQRKIEVPPLRLFQGDNAAMATPPEGRP